MDGLDRQHANVAKDGPFMEVQGRHEPQENAKRLNALDLRIAGLQGLTSGGQKPVS